MDEILDPKSEHPNKRFFVKRALLTATFLGGPLIGGYMLSENFKTLGMQKKVRLTWFYTVIVTALILYVAMKLPEDSNIPSALFSIIYVLVAAGAYSQLQETKINDSLNAGALSHSFGRSALVTIIGVIITGLTFFSIFYFTETNTAKGIASKQYGTVVKHTIEYKEDSITESEIDEIASALTLFNFFDMEQEKYVYVERKGETTHVYISVIEGLENNQEGIDYFKDLKQKTVMKLPEYNIVFQLVVNDIKNVVVTLE